MDVLIDPNIAYLVLVGCFMLIALALISPGTGVLEAGAVITLVLAGYSIYNLPINLWSLILLILGLALFILAVRKPGKVIYLVSSILALVLGSAFLFRGEAWWQPAVNLILAGVTSVLAGAFFWISARKVLEAESVRPTHDLEALVGATGEAKSDIHLEGSVQVDGELWSAFSDQPIPSGAIIRVVGREGFLLKVEPKA